MALRGTLTHRKTRRLANALDIPVPCALGVLEALWHLTASQAPAGDIGRLSDQDIADEILWPNDAGVLVAALVAVGSLDTHETHRLVVHDWEQHCDQAVRRKLGRNDMKFASREQRRLVVASHNLVITSETLAIASLPEPEPEPEPKIVGAGAPSPNGASAPKDFLGTLRMNPTYAQINIDAELGKMDAWLLAHPGRKKTHRFVVNWLNKVDVPLAPAEDEEPWKGMPHFFKCAECGVTHELPYGDPKHCTGKAAQF
jgi:hypothetical protein